MKIEENTELTIGLFKKVYFFEQQDVGIVLENEGHIVCVYATDGEHQKIYASVPLCHPKYLRNIVFQIRCQNDKILLYSENLSVYVDFSFQKCACTLADVQIFGSEFWGQRVSVPFKEKYLEMFREKL